MARTHTKKKTTSAAGAKKKKTSTAARKTSPKKPAAQRKTAKKPASQQARPRPGGFVWHELMTPDVKGAKKFYGSLFGWTYEEMNMGQFAYTMFNLAGQQPSIGGMMPMHGPEWQGVPPHWMVYVGVDDVDETAQKCQKLGGRVCVPPTDIPNGVGRFAVLSDPGGATFSVYRSARG